MAKITLGGKEIEFDEDGFMQEPDLWDQNVTMNLAKIESVQEMTERHWKVVNYIRSYYQKFGIAPMIRKLCKECDLKLKKIY